MQLRKLIYIESPSVNPYYNLALEKFLFDTVEEDCLILYLWQNEKTVVCGRNQNTYKECHISRLTSDGGHVARRLSGGGAVFHDLGNLNFTFIARDNSYNLNRQLSVITRACKSFGIPAEITGRNDITADGRKFSGNAFYKSGGTRYHHGTIMINVDFSKLSDYLNVDRSKLQSKGVSSVKSRVVNLTDFNKNATVPNMKLALRNALEEEYGIKSEYYGQDIDENRVEELRNLFSSELWIFGAEKNFENTMSKRFEWGDFELHTNVKNRVITDAVIYSDALDDAFILKIAHSLSGIPYSADALVNLIEHISDAEHDIECEDIISLIRGSI